MSKRQAISKKTREIVYNKYDGHCAYCGCKLGIKDMQVDHFAPVYLFGDNININNLMPSCRSCNFYKNTLTINKFRKQLGEIKSRLERDSFIYRMAKKYGLIEEKDKYIQFYYEKVGEVLDD